MQREFEFPNALVTITGAEITQDFREAKVFVSVLGGHSKSILEKLNKKRAVVQQHISKRLTIRVTPVLDFRLDASAERGVDMIHLLDEVDQLPKAEPNQEVSENGEHSDT